MRQENKWNVMKVLILYCSWHLANFVLGSMPVKRVSLSIATPLGNLEGIFLPGLSMRKGEYIGVPFMDPWDINILSLGAIWNFGKGTVVS
jgi:hypothetical protein